VCEQDCIATGRSQGAQKKERGAVALKKGLDRLAVDLANPELKVRPHLPPYLTPI